MIYYDHIGLNFKKNVFRLNVCVHVNINQLHVIVGYNAVFKTWLNYGSHYTKPDLLVCQKWPFYLASD